MDSRMHKQLGKRIKQLRLSKHLTLEALAALSKVSKSMISKIERGSAVPTTTTLSRLAEALGERTSSIFFGVERDHKQVLVMRRDEQAVFLDPRTRLRRRSLSPIFPSRGIDVVQLTIPAHKSSGMRGPHRGGVEEYLVVTRGELTVRVGKVTYLLTRGDSMYYHGDIEHELLNRSRSQCEIIVVVNGQQLRR